MKKAKGGNTFIQDITDSNLNYLVPPLHSEGMRKFIPVGVSARHVHLSSDHVEALFGYGYELQIQKELSQPGQFAATDTVMLAGPKGVIDKVRILGPARHTTQVEVALTDAHRLGASPPIRDSGDLVGSSSITIIGPKGSIYLPEGMIIASRHIHMTLEDAENFHVSDGDHVHVTTQSKRPIIFRDVKIRVSPMYRLEFHIDTDEGNAAHLHNTDRVVIIGKGSM